MSERKIPEYIPEIITLCGSTRFKEQFMKVAEQLGLEGKLVFTVARFSHAENREPTPEIKERLDQLHLRKIDVSDSIYVIDVDGYVGESTRNEIKRAIEQEKTVYWYSRGGKEDDQRVKAFN